MLTCCHLHSIRSPNDAAPGEADLSLALSKPQRRNLAGCSAGRAAGCFVLQVGGPRFERNVPLGHLQGLLAKSG
jgi:hypothetical protein